MRVEHLGLGGARRVGGFEAAEPAEDVEVLDVVEVDLVGPALLGPVLVDERVGEDLVEPRLEVRALAEAPEAAVRAQVRLLHEVLGVGRVARHAQRGRVERRHVRHRLFCEAAPDRPCRAGYPGAQIVQSRGPRRVLRSQMSQLEGRLKGMDSVSEAPVREPSRASGSWITAAVAVAGLIVIAVVVAATVTSNGKGVGIRSSDRAQDRAGAGRPAQRARPRRRRSTPTTRRTARRSRRCETSNRHSTGAVVCTSSLTMRRSLTSHDASFAVLERSTVGLPHRSRSENRSRSLRRECRLPRRTIDLRHHLFDRRCRRRLARRHVLRKRACPAVATPADRLVARHELGRLVVESPGAGDARTGARTRAAKPRWTTFRTAIAAYQAMGPNPWPEGDAAASASTLMSRRAPPCSELPLSLQQRDQPTEGEHVVLRPRDAPVHVAVRRVV